MDFRFMKGVRNYLDAHNMVGDCDLVSIAGAAKNIADPASESEREFLLKQIMLSHKLHNMKRLVLMNHLDCGAYGGSAAFENPAAEKAKHTADLKKAAEIIKNTYPDVEVCLAIASLDEKGDVAFEEIG